MGYSILYTSSRKREQFMTDGNGDFHFSFDLRKSVMVFNIPHAGC